MSINQIPIMSLPQGPRIQTPIEALEQVARTRGAQQQVRMNDLEIGEKERAIRESQEAQRILANARGSTPLEKTRNALPELSRVSPRMAQETAMMLDKWDKLGVEKQREMLGLAVDRGKVVAQAFGAMNDPSQWEPTVAGLERQGALDAQAAAVLRQSGYNPQIARFLRDKAVEASTQAQIENDALNRRARANEPTAAMKEFDARYKNWREVNNKPHNASSEAEYRKIERQQEIADAKAKKTEPTVLIQTVDEKGNAVQKIVPKTAGSEFKPGQTADMRNKDAARQKLVPAFTSLESLSQKIITEKSALLQRIKASGREVDAALADDPEYRTYQDARKAFALQLAVATQGSRPSDTDMISLLNIIPDAFRDTPMSAKMKWDMLKTQMQIDGGGKEKHGTGDPLGIR